MGRSASSFGRSGPRYKVQPIVLVICEDKKSGKNYLDDAAVHFRIKVKVEISHCGKTDPKSIVEEGIKQSRKYDFIYCVVDRDTHANFDEAVRVADRSKNVLLIPSYPCFEYWLLLHFEESRKPFTAKGKKSAGDLVADALRGYAEMQQYEKGSDWSVFNALVESRFEKARERSARIYADAKNCDEMNPSTELHVLMDFFEKLSKPQPVTGTKAASK
jgi:hypothetical protein